jgi:hypothetical protein
VIKINRYFFLLNILLSSAFITNICTAQNLFINEFMASNSSTITDPDFNNYADWIEIYNAEVFAVNIKDYFITDDLNNPQKYKIPTDLIIAAGGYLLIWADDSSFGNHTNFKLSASGESIGLYDPAALLIDTLTYGEQQNDISEGRYPDGETGRYKFFPSSPGSPNIDENIFNKLLEPVFSISGGFYSSSITLTLSHPEPGAAIHYTIDGTTPTTGSLVYINPIVIDSTTAVTVKVFEENFLPSNVVVNTYFINFEVELPVFSIVTDPANFFSDTSGIYVAGTNGIPGNCSSNPRNWNQDWERPINMEFFETDNSHAFNVKAGVKINGGCSRLYAMKSLGFYFRGEYGFSKLNYPLFPNSPITTFNNFILRSSAQDWWRTMFRDGMVQTLIKKGMNVAVQEYRPSVVFINGQYWGIHNIREKLNSHYLNSHYEADLENIDLIEISKGVYANNGDLVEYNSMINFLSAQNMSLPENYNHIKSIVDIDDFIDYQIAQIYSANGDWPGSNQKLWRPRNSSGKWRWMIYDLDFTFGGNAQGQYYTNTLEQATAVNGPDWPNPPWSTLMLRKLLENQEFKNEFIQRFAVHMNTTFEPAHVNAVIDSLGGVIASEIPRHKSRWPNSISFGSTWQQHVQVMKDFADLRQPRVRNHFNSKFNLSGSYSLIISRNNADWGKVFTHNIEVKNNSSTNIFFDNIPLKVKAVAMPGFRFVRWEGISISTSAEIEIAAENNSFLTAVFEPVEITESILVINEINYRSFPSFDTEDWIELYNTSEIDLDISGWKLRDNNISNAFTFPAGSEIQAKGYLVICRDTSEFNAFHLDIENVYGNFDFGLSSDGDMILLFDPHNKLIDSVAYETSGEWTSLPNGNGPTLSLINPFLDNTLAENWKASILYGTPSKMNDVYTNIEKEEFKVISDFYLSNNYPNPFNPTTIISWQSPVGSHQTLKVYDLLGREVAILVDEFKPAGSYEVEFDGSEFSSGIYIYMLYTENFSAIGKMTLLK